MHINAQYQHDVVPDDWLQYMGPFFCFYFIYIYKINAFRGKNRSPPTPALTPGASIGKNTALLYFSLDLS